MNNLWKPVLTTLLTGVGPNEMKNKLLKTLIVIIVMAVNWLAVKGAFELILPDDNMHRENYILGVLLFLATLNFVIALRFAIKRVWVFFGLFMWVFLYDFLAILSASS